MCYQSARSSDCGGDGAASGWERSRRVDVAASSWERRECLKTVQELLNEMRVEIRNWRYENQAEHSRLLSALRIAKVGKSYDVAIGEARSEVAPSIINNEESVDCEGSDGPASSIVSFDVLEKVDLVLFQVDEKVDLVPSVQPNQGRLQMNRPQCNGRRNGSCCRRNRQCRSCSLTNTYVVFASIIGGRRYMINWIPRFHSLKLLSSNSTFKGPSLCSVFSVSGVCARIQPYICVNYPNDNGVLACVHWDPEGIKKFFCSSKGSKCLYGASLCCHISLLPHFSAAGALLSPVKMLKTDFRRGDYQLTPTNQVFAIMRLLRENKNRFDMVIRNVQMLDMDGFQLLELIGLEMDCDILVLFSLRGHSVYILCHDMPFGNFYVPKKTVRFGDSSNCSPVHADSAGNVAGLAKIFALPLIDMYATSGDIVSDCKVFEKMFVGSFVMRSVKIGEEGLYGHGREAFLLCIDMVNDGHRPNEVPFNSLLSAYSHAGLVCVLVGSRRSIAEGVTYMGGDTRFVIRPLVGSTFRIIVGFKECNGSVSSDLKKVLPMKIQKLMQGVKAVLVDSKYVRGIVTVYHLQKLGIKTKVVNDINMAFVFCVALMPSLLGLVLEVMNSFQASILVVRLMIKKFWADKFVKLNLLVKEGDFLDEMPGLQDLVVVLNLKSRQIVAFESLDLDQPGKFKRSYLSCIVDGSVELSLPKLSSCDGSRYALRPIPSYATLDKTLSYSQTLVALPVLNVDALAFASHQSKTRRPHKRTRRPFPVAEVEALLEVVEDLGDGGILSFWKLLVVGHSFIFAIKRYDTTAAKFIPCKQKDGALLAIRTLCDKLKQTEPYLERMLVQHVLPEIRSLVGCLRAKVVWVAGEYVHLKFADHNNVRHVFHCIVCGLRDPKLPVRVDSVFALRSFVEACKDLNEICHILPRLLDEFFKLMNEVENADLVFTLETIVDKFGEERAPYALSFCQNLATAFWKCLESSEAKEVGDEASLQSFASGGQFFVFMAHKVHKQWPDEIQCLLLQLLGPGDNVWYGIFAGIILTFSCFAIVIAMIALLVWSSVSVLLNRSTKIPRLVLRDEFFSHDVMTIVFETNRFLGFVQDVALRRSMKQFLGVLLSLWTATVLGLWFNFLTVIYDSLVAAHTLPRSSIIHSTIVLVIMQMFRFVWKKFCWDNTTTLKVGIG